MTKKAPNALSQGSSEGVEWEAGRLKEKRLGFGFCCSSFFSNCFFPCIFFCFFSLVFVVLFFPIVFVFSVLFCLVFVVLRNLAYLLSVSFGDSEVF